MQEVYSGSLCDIAASTGVAENMFSRSDPDPDPVGLNAVSVFKEISDLDKDYLIVGHNLWQDEFNNTLLTKRGWVISGAYLRKWSCCTQSQIHLQMSMSALELPLSERTRQTHFSLSGCPAARRYSVWTRSGQVFLKRPSRPIPKWNETFKPYKSSKFGNLSSIFDKICTLFRLPYVMTLNAATGQ
jgi:hypothetical protein